MQSLMQPNIAPITTTGLCNEYHIKQFLLSIDFHEIGFYKFE